MVTLAKKKTTPLKCNGTTFLVLILLQLGLIYFVITKHVQLHNDSDSEAAAISNNNGPLRSLTTPQQQSQSHTPIKITKKKPTRQIEPVSCAKYLNDKSIYDPNVESKLSREESKRLTITEPKFWISLHSMF